MSVFIPAWYPPPHLSWMLELLEWWDCRLDSEPEHTEDTLEDTLDSRCG